MGNFKKHQRLIDPDLASILGVSFSGLGGIGGVYAAFTYIQYQKDKQIRKESFNEELKGFQKAIDEVERSLYLFQFSIGILERLIERSNKRLEFDLYEEKVEYGKLKVLLTQYEFERFDYTQRNIYSSLRDYQINLLTIERFLQEYPIEMSHNQRLKHLSSLEYIVNELNHVNRNISKLTVREFLTVIQLLPRHIMENITSIRQSYLD